MSPYVPSQVGLVDEGVRTNVTLMWSFTWACGLSLNWFINKVFKNRTCVDSRMDLKLLLVHETLSASAKTKPDRICPKIFNRSPYLSHLKSRSLVCLLCDAGRKEERNARLEIEIQASALHLVTLIWHFSSHLPL